MGRRVPTGRVCCFAQTRAVIIPASLSLTGDGLVWFAHLLGARRIALRAHLALPVVPVPQTSSFPIGD
jgi:hypothetical protein